MLTLLIFFVVLVLVMSAVGRMARASRRRAYEEEQRRLEESRRNGSQEQISPFAGMPFGGIFEEMFRGMETRSYRIDPPSSSRWTITEEQARGERPVGAPARSGRKDWPEFRQVRGDLERFKQLIESSGEETGAWRGEVRDGETQRG